MTSQERSKFRARRSKCMQSLKHSFKKVSVSHAQLAHFSTLANEKHMLLVLNFSTLTFITNARTTMPFARLHSQMVCTQSEPAETPQHMFVQILVQVEGDRKWRTSSRTTLRTPTPLVIRHCFLVYCARTWKISFPPYLQMSETQLANELLHGNLCGSQHFLFEHCTTLQSIERIRDLSRRPARTIKKQDANLPSAHDVESHCWNQACLKKTDGSTEPEELQRLLTALSKHRPVCCAVFHSKNAPQGTQMPLL